MKKILNLTLSTMVIVSCLSGLTSFAAEGDTYLDKRACTAGPAVVETPFDIDFGSFSSDEVYGTTHLNTGTIVQGGATLHTSNSPAVATALPYLVVSDRCGSGARHADLLGSDMADQDVSNAVTASDIPADNMTVGYDGLSNNLHYLGNTPVIDDVSAYPYPGAPMGSAWQMITRTAFDDKDIPGLFGIRPKFELSIPSYQQPDRYEGTITWTVIMQ